MIGTLTPDGLAATSGTVNWTRTSRDTNGRDT